VLEGEQRATAKPARFLQMSRTLPGRVQLCSGVSTLPMGQFALPDLRISTILCRERRTRTERRSRPTDGL